MVWLQLQLLQHAAAPQRAQHTAAAQRVQHVKHDAAAQHAQHAEYTHLDALVQCGCGVVHLVQQGLALGRVL